LAAISIGNYISFLSTTYVLIANIYRHTKQSNSEIKGRKRINMEKKNSKETQKKKKVEEKKRDVEESVDTEVQIPATPQNSADNNKDLPNSETRCDDGNHLEERQQGRIVKTEIIADSESSDETQDESSEEEVQQTRTNRRPKRTASGRVKPLLTSKIDIYSLVKEFPEQPTLNEAREKWPVWHKSILELFEYGIKNASEDQKILLLTMRGGPYIRDIVREGREPKTLTAALAKVEQHLNNNTNVVSDQTTFDQLHQHPEEKFEIYAKRVRNMATIMRVKVGDGRLIARIAAGAIAKNELHLFTMTRKEATIDELIAFGTQLENRNVGAFKSKIIPQEINVIDEQSKETDDNQWAMINAYDQRGGQRSNMGPTNTNRPRYGPPMQYNWYGNVRPTFRPSFLQPGPGPSRQHQSMPNAMRGMPRPMWMARPQYNYNPRFGYQQTWCKNCGGQAHNRNQCPAAGQVCMACGGLNHFMRVCPKQENNSAGSSQSKV
jgi:Tfp pilus assembly protein PilE